MTIHPDFPAGPAELLEEAGRAAGKVLAARSPRWGASRLSWRETIAMAALLGECGLALPRVKDPSKEASKAVQTPKKGGL